MGPLRVSFVCFWRVCWWWETLFSLTAFVGTGRTHCAARLKFTSLPTKTADALCTTHAAQLQLAFIVLLKYNARRRVSFPAMLRTAPFSFSFSLQRPPPPLAFFPRSFFFISFLFLPFDDCEIRFIVYGVSEANARLIERSDWGKPDWLRKPIPQSKSNWESDW